MGVTTGAGMESNPLSVLNDYERAHLPTHLAEIGLFEDLHRLLRIELNERENAWYEIKQQHDEASAYLADIQVAWAAAEQHHDIALECRYALTSATWNSLASSLHPLMYVALVERGVWTASRAFTAAMRSTLLRTQTLALLAQYLTEVERKGVFAEVAEDLRNKWRDPDDLREKIVRLLPESVVRQLIAFPVEHPNANEYLPESLAHLLPRLAQLGHAEQAWIRAEALPDSPVRFRALCGVAPSLGLKDGAQVLDRLAVQFRPSGRIFPDALCLRALAAGFASLSLSERAIETAQRDTWLATRDHTLEIVTSTLLHEGRVEWAFECGKLIIHPCRFACVLARASDHVSDTRRSYELAVALQSARNVSNGQTESLRIVALAEIGSRLPDPDTVLTEAVDAALALGGFSRGGSIAEIASLLTPELLRRVLLELQGIKDHVTSSRVLTEAASACRGDARTRIALAACEMAASVGRVHERWAALLRLLPIGGKIRPDLILQLQQVADETVAGTWDRDEAIEFPNPLDDQVAEIALRAARGSPEARAAFVVALAPGISNGLLPHLEDLATEIDDPKRRREAFVALSPRVSMQHLGALVEANTFAGDDGSDLLFAVAAARHSEIGQEQQALKLANKIKDRSQRFSVFALIAKQASSPQFAVNQIIQELSEITWRPPDLRISFIADSLSPEDAVRLLLAARNWVAALESDRDTVLEDIVGPLTRTGMIHEAQKAVEEIADRAKKFRALLAMARELNEPARGEMLSRLLKFANSTAENLERSFELSTLLPELREPDRDRVAQQIDLQALAAEQPRWVADIVQHVLPTRLDQLLMLDRDVVNASIVERTHDLPEGRVRELWRILTHRAGARTRSDALESVRLALPWVQRLGGEFAVENVCQAVTQVRRWWP
jgi:hypothetical protein